LIVGLGHLETLRSDLATHFLNVWNQADAYGFQFEDQETFIGLQ
jgi:hypothetical protein